MASNSFYIFKLCHWGPKKVLKYTPLSTLRKSRYYKLWILLPVFWIIFWFTFNAYFNLWPRLSLVNCNLQLAGLTVKHCYTKSGTLSLSMGLSCSLGMFNAKCGLSGDRTRALFASYRKREWECKLESRYIYLMKI